MNHVADDIPIWRENYKLMTKEQLNIPGLHMMGHAHFQEVAEKLDAHFHRNLEFVVIVKGRQRYVVGNKTYMLYGNEMFTTYPYENHGNEGFNQDVCEFIWFQIDLSDVQDFLGLSFSKGKYLYDQFLKYHTRTKKINTVDIALLQKAFDLLSSKEVSRQNFGHILFLEFIMKNICVLENKSQKEEYSEDIDIAISYIHENLFADLNIALIAEKCGLSVSRFKTKFKEQMGTTPHSYINELKIDSAKIYLKDENLSITDISYILNFSSSNHFAAVFKKYTGCTPTQFRQQNAPYVY